MILTVGHGTRSLEALLRLLDVHGVQQVVDVRRYPMSTRFPHFCRVPLQHALGRFGIGYHHWPELGGRRPVRGDPSAAGLPLPLRGFGEYMQTEGFANELYTLMGFSSKLRTALMCSEAAFWRCHRSLIGDGLLAHGHSVLHIVDEGAPVESGFTRGARVTAVSGGSFMVTYPKLEAGSRVHQ